MIAWKLSIRACCQPGSSPAANSGSVGRLPRTPTAEGVRWNTIDVLGRLRQRGQALDAGGAGADEPHDLVAELGEAGSPGAPPVIS